MIRLTFVLLAVACIAHAATADLIKIDPSLLASIPAKRHAALTLYTITARDSTPAIGEKKAMYIETLKGLIRNLLDTYYWHGEFPKGIDEAIEKRAVYEAGLWYPASPTTGASFYGDLVQRYTIRMYEEEVVTIASAICARVDDRDVTITAGKAPLFNTWKQAWDEAGDVNNGPNQLPGSPAQGRHTH